MSLQNRETLAVLLTHAINNFDEGLEATLGEAGGFDSVEELKSLLSIVENNTSLELTDSSEILNVENAIKLYREHNEQEVDEDEKINLYLVEVVITHPEDTSTVMDEKKVLIAEFSGNNARIEGEQYILDNVPLHTGCGVSAYTPLTRVRPEDFE